MSDPIEPRQGQVYVRDGQLTQEGQEMLLSLFDALSDAQEQIAALEARVTALEP